MDYIDTVDNRHVCCQLYILERPWPKLLAGTVDNYQLRHAGRRAYTGNHQVIHLPHINPRARSGEGIGTGRSIAQYPVGHGEWQLWQFLDRICVLRADAHCLYGRYRLWH